MELLMLWCSNWIGCLPHLLELDFLRVSFASLTAVMFFFLKRLVMMRSLLTSECSALPPLRCSRMFGVEGG
jgi:hypothetical protein